ncbi:MAG: hypothetical protein GW941_00935 [Candidatus Pacebacteria bacterium]|nr:hypothetical protein [Candidatus Paceibacterota bacterium]
MSNKKEISIGLNRFESSAAFRIFLALILLTIIQVSSIDASDDSTETETAITLIIDQSNESLLDATIDQANRLAESLPSSEEELNTLTVNITTNINVRSLGANFGNTDSSFPRGPVEAIGYFTDGPLQGRASGAWLVLDNGDHAVFASLVYEDDGTRVSAQELTGLQEYSYDGTRYVPLVEPELEAAPVAPTTTPNIEGTQAAPTQAPNNPERTGTGTATANPETSSSFPELPDTIEIEHYNIFETESPRTTTTTVEINQDHLLPVELGLITEGYSDITDSIGFWGEPVPEATYWQRIPVSGIIVEVLVDEYNGYRFPFVQVLTKTPGGEDIVLQLEVRSNNGMRFIPVNQDFNRTLPKSETDIFYDSKSMVDNDVIHTPGSGRDLRPGDQVIVYFENVEVGGHTPSGGNWTSNSEYNRIPDGTPTAVFEAVDDGKIRRDVPVFLAFGAQEIIYRED